MFSPRSLSEHREKQKYTVAVDCQSLPEQIIREAIFKQMRHSSSNRTPQEKQKVLDFRRKKVF